MECYGIEMALRWDDGNGVDVRYLAYDAHYTEHESESGWIERIYGRVGRTATHAEERSFGI